MKSFGLAKIASLSISDAILNHRFVTELIESLSSREPSELVSSPVFGTQNTKSPELYGWTDSVPGHVDNKGYCYFILLHGPEGAKLGADHSETITFNQGDVICMNDFTTHWVEQTGTSVALFVGAFDHRCDDHALDLIKIGLKQLEEREYYGAPHYHGRTLQKDECFAMCKTPPPFSSPAFEDISLYRKLLVDAQKDGDFIETCNHEGCDNHACKLDHLYPYDAEKNKCLEHLVDLKDSIQYV